MEAIIENQFVGDPRDVSNYEKFILDAEQHRFSLVFDNLRLTFQQIERNAYATMEVILERCSREKPDFVLIPLVGSQILRSQKEVDNHMQEIFNNTSQYKIGKAERIIYQRVHGLRQVNTPMSTLYNFTS